MIPTTMSTTRLSYGIMRTAIDSLLLVERERILEKNSRNHHHSKLLKNRQNPRTLIILISRRVLMDFTGDDVYIAMATSRLKVPDKRSPTTTTREKGKKKTRE